MFFVRIVDLVITVDSVVIDGFKLSLRLIFLRFDLYLMID